MQHQDLLIAFAQVSATFAGFSGVIGVFRRDSSPSELKIDALQVRGVVELSVLGALLALLPFIPDGFGTSEPLTWRICSGIAAVALLAGFIGGMRRGRVSTGEVMATDPLLVGVGLMGIGTTQIILWLNVAGVAPSAAATAYVLVLLLALANVGFMFVRLLIPRS